MIPFLHAPGANAPGAFLISALIRTKFFILNQFYLPGAQRCVILLLILISLRMSKQQEIFPMQPKIRLLCRTAVLLALAGAVYLPLQHHLRNRNA